MRGRVEVAWERAAAAFSLAATVPVNAVAEVRIPFAVGSAATLAAAEGNVTFFAAGAFVPGAVAGITAAAVDAASGTLAVSVGAGAYAFVATW